MKILLLGSGGRENAFAWKLVQSPLCSKLFIAPGNAGTLRYGINVNIAADDFPSIRTFVIQENINMVVVGPEDPLVKGITDFFETDEALKSVPVIGPGKMGAQLEGSKDFSKQFMTRQGIPTARYATFTRETLAQGESFLEIMQAPYVLKADGLAAGKGVLIASTLEEAKSNLREMLEEKKFGNASESVVIEEFLKGIELSVFVLTDSHSFVVLPEAKDYKRVGENDTGLNTGGMGAVSPVPFADAAFMNKTIERIIRPTIEGLKKDNIRYKGFIFIGLMNVNGEPYVIEYNVRMGDPETEVVLPRLKNDLVEMFVAVAEGSLDKIKISTDPRIALTVMLVSGGYPGDYEKNKIISGLDYLGSQLVFHAGTSMQNNNIVTTGGRVIAVTSLGKSIAEAKALSMAAAGAINFDKKYFRKDIGDDLAEL